MNHFPIYTDPTPSCIGDEPITTPSAPVIQQHQPPPLSHYTQSSMKLHLKPAVVGKNIKAQVFVESSHQKRSFGMKYKNFTSRPCKDQIASFDKRGSKATRTVSFIHENSIDQKSNKTGQKSSTSQQHAVQSIQEIDVSKNNLSQIKCDAEERASSSKSLKISQQQQQQQLQQLPKQPLSQSFISKPISSKISSNITPRPKQYHSKPTKSKHEPLSLSEQLNASLVSDIGRQIANYLRKEDPRTLALNSLQKHDIVSDLRCKMVDWMIEVLTNFKSQDQTLFLAVSLLDRYFAVSDIKCTVVDLHLTGIISMFAASKIEDPLPLTLDMAQNNIGHKRFTGKQLRIAEMKILSTLGWRIQTPTIYQNVLVILELILPLTTYTPSQYKIGAISVPYKQARMKLQKHAVYLGMIALHDYQLITKTQSSVIARACLIFAFRILILAKDKKRECGRQYMLESLGLTSEEQFYYQIKMFSMQDGVEMYNKYKIKQNKTVQRIQELYFNFEGLFRGVNNLRRLCEDVKPQNIGVKRRQIQDLMSESICDEKLSDMNKTTVSKRYGIR